MTDLILGMDEAGKGPVIGPMALAGCLVTKEEEKQLRRLGVKDSKTVTPKRRDFLEREIKKIIEKYEIVVCEAEEIDKTNFEGTKLTLFEAQKFAKIINNLNTGEEKIKVIIDCPSIGIKSWTDMLKTRVKDLSNLEFVIEHKADKNHISVSTASILAKCERERGMAKLKEIYGEEIGSGYASDPLTQKFLEKYALKYKNKGIFRKCWATWKNAAEKIKQEKLVV